jgi:hypothetical protein
LTLPERTFFRQTHPYFLEIRQDSCENLNVPDEKIPRPSSIPPVIEQVYFSTL